MPAIFGSTVLLANTPQAVVKNIYDIGVVVTANLVNNSGSAATISVAISANQASPGASEWIAYNQTLAPGGGVVEFAGLSISPGQYIVVRSSSASVASQVWGYSPSSITNSANDIVVQPAIMFGPAFTGTLVATNFSQFSGGTPLASRSTTNVNTWTPANNNYFAYTSPFAPFADVYYPTPNGNRPWGVMRSNGTTAMAIDANSGVVLTTTDGADWLTASGSLGAPANSGFWNQAAVSDTGTWVVMSGTYGTSNQVAYSTNTGASWTVITPVPSNWRTTNLVWANNTFAATNSFNSGQLYSSTDGISWTARTFPHAGTLLWALSQWWMININYAAGSLQVSSSTDLVTWTTTTPTASNVGAGTSGSVAFGNGVFVIVKSTNSSSWTSTDGVTWTEQTGKFTNPSLNNNSPTLSFARGVFISLTSSFISGGSTVYKGNCYASTDGITWYTSLTPPAVASSGFGNHTVVVGLN
jgi:hypothetical protein